MKKSALAILAVLAVVAMGSSAFAEFKSVPVDPDFLEAAGKMLLNGKTEWLAGEIEVGGKKMKAAILDMGQDGINLSQPGDILLAGLNGNGKFDVDLKSYAMAELLYLTNEVLIGGKTFTVAFDEEKADLALEPLDAPQGKITFDLKLDRKPKGYEFMIFSMGETPGQDFKMYKGLSADLPASIRTGKLNIGSGMLVLAYEEGPAQMFQFAGEKPVEIEEGKTLTLALKAPESIEVTVAQKGRKLSVNKKMAVEGGVKYQMIAAVPDMTRENPKPPEGPQVEILDEEGKVLAKGNMEYG